MDYFTKVLSGPSSNSSNSQLHELLGMVHNQVVKLEYVYFPLKLVKRQKREKKVSMQRIEDGNVSFVLDFSSAEYMKQVSALYVGVKRTNETSNSDRSIGCVPIRRIDLACVQDTKILVKVDLDSVHIYNGRKVYELDRAREELNLFHLIIDIRFSNGEFMTLNTRPFKLIGRKCTGTASGKRSSTDSKNSGSVEPRMGTSVIQAVPAVKDEESGESGYGSPSSPNSQMSSPGGTQDLIEACTVVAEHIKTKFLDLDGESIINLNSVQAIKTPNGDIAYHFLLDNANENFVEGEVIGFLPNKNSTNKQVVAKLTFENASFAILKGVITRSQYLEAQKPPDGVRSETIAMMGIVPVQVHGSVSANEALYASPTHPGFAVSARHLDMYMKNEAAFIGYAFSSRKSEDHCSVGLVQAAVSVLQSAGFRLLQEKIGQIEDRFNEEISNIKRNNTRTRRFVWGCAVFFTILIIMTAIFVWQITDF